MSRKNKELSILDIVAGNVILLYGIYAESKDK